MQASSDVTWTQRAKALADSALVVDILAPEAPGGAITNADFERFIGAYVRAGVHWASLTVEVGGPSIERAVRLIAQARRYIRANADRFLLLETVADVARAKAEGRVALNFNFQTTDPLLQDLDMIEVYRRLGVGHMLMAYNNRNFVADGCHEPSNAGLSRFGVQVVQEMNRVGMIVDLSHTGYRSTMDAIEASSAPVIFSHSNPRSLNDHERNIWDDQIKAAAATGGVIGINGVGLFMSPDATNISAELIFKNLDYTVQLVGPEHVGLGIDYFEKLAELRQFAQDNKEKYSDSQGYFDREYAFASPEVIPALIELMLKHNYPDDDVRAILGANWLRVCAQVWRTFEQQR